MSILTKICLHWSAGAYFPCSADLTAYHYCVDKIGRIYPGKHKPEDNLNCYDGNYAMHCGGGNTGCIGLSACAMAGFTSDNADAIHWVFSLIIISYPTNAVDFQSKKPTRVALVGFPVNGLIT